MLGSAATAATTTSTSTNGAGTSSISNAAHLSYTSIRCTTTSSLPSRSLSPSNQLSPATLCKITAFPIKAMAGTLTTPKHGAMSSVSGKRQALIHFQTRKI